MKTLEAVPYVPGASDDRLLDVFLPDAERFPVLVYFHGGGIEAGTRRDLALVPHLVERGVAVVSADYRMYPHAVYPEFIRDAAAAVAWVHNNLGAYGADGRLFVGGSSAGSYLSQMLCFDKKYLVPHGLDPDSFAGFIHDAGQPTVHFNVLRERGIDARRVMVDEAAPLYHVTENPSYPPMLFLVSDHDMPGRFEQIQLMYATLREMGNDMSKIHLRLMENSRHCEYVEKKDARGNSIFGAILYDFIASQTAERNG